MKYITPQEAAQIDEQLMSDAGGFRLEQLVELAGLACATALAKSFPGKGLRVLGAAGPGNQGADGLCAARHLLHFGYRPTVYLPKVLSHSPCCPLALA
jgi:NAD(P)H-hydrate epimerase